MSHLISPLDTLQTWGIVLTLTASHLNCLPPSTLLSQGFLQSQGQGQLHNFRGAVQTENVKPPFS